MNHFCSRFFYRPIHSLDQPALTRNGGRRIRNRVVLYPQQLQSADVSSSMPVRFTSLTFSSWTVEGGPTSTALLCRIFSTAPSSYTHPRWESEITLPAPRLPLQYNCPIPCNLGHGLVISHGVKSGTLMVSIGGGKVNATIHNDPNLTRHGLTLTSTEV